MLDKTPVSLIETELQRSMPCPLQIDMTLRTNRYSVVQMIAQHMNRWKEISIETTATARMNGVLEFLSGKQAPILTRFSVKDGLSEEFPEDFVGTGSGVALLNGPSSAPRLKEVLLWSACLDWDRHPFSDLHSLEVAYLPYGTSAHRCTHLRLYD